MVIMRMRVLVLSIIIFSLFLSLRLVGRDKLESELEVRLSFLPSTHSYVSPDSSYDYVSQVLLQTTPFETYSLTRGHKNGILGRWDDMRWKDEGLYNDDIDDGDDEGLYDDDDIDDDGDDDDWW